MFADTDGRYGRTARRHRDVDPQPEAVIRHPTMAIVFIDLAALANNQQPAKGVVRPDIAETDRDGLPQAAAFDREFIRTCPVDISDVGIINKFLEWSIAKQKIHSLLSEIGRIVPRSQTLLISCPLNQVFQNRSINTPGSDVGDQHRFSCQYFATDLCD